MGVGALVFKASDPQGGAHLVVVDAHTMKEISIARLPIPIPYTVHGEFYARHRHVSNASA